MASKEVMGKLRDWVEANATITQEKFDENDITLNTRIRKIFFEQLEDLAFDAKELNNGSYMISLRLDFPRKTEMPYTFLFDSKKKTIIPQYTITHRVFRTSEPNEVETLTNLEFYLQQNPINKNKSNPAFSRDRSNYFRSKTGELINDVIRFEFKDTDENLYQFINGKFVLYYEDNVVAYQHGSKDFCVMSSYMDIKISSTYENDILTMYVYNIPQELKDNPSRLIMGVKC